MQGEEIFSGHEDNSVLIFNDEPDQLRLMRGLLQKAGYSVLTANDGREGFALAKRERADLVISDVTMPHMDGLEFCRLLLGVVELKNVPIIAVTAHQETGFRTDAKASGFDAYVTKPIDINWLKELINGLI